MNATTTAELVTDLRRRVDEGELEPGTKLPSTRELRRDTGLSESGVFRAISLLKAQGYLTSRQGKGVFVAERRRQRVAGTQRIRRITQPGEEIHWRHTIRTDAPDWVSEQIGPGECVERARTVRRGDLILEASRSWVHLDIVEVVPELDEPAPCDPTWQAIYADRSGATVENPATYIEPRLATADDLEALSLESDGVYAVAAVRNVYAVGDRVIGVGEVVPAPGQRLDIKVSA